MVEMVSARTPQTMTEKILARASGRPFVRPGDDIEACPDFVISYDFPGYTDVFFREAREEFGVDKVQQPERFVLFIDHMVPAATPKEEELHRVTRTWGARQGVPVHERKGIGHQVSAELGYATPGAFVVHFDGHAWATAPSGTSADLTAIWGSSAHDLWAGGLTMLHGDGARWTPAAAGLPTGRGTDPGLVIQSLTGLGRAVLAFGTPLVDSTEPNADAFRWNGARWVRLQTGTGRALLAASSAGDVLWTAGELGTLLERRCAATLQ